MSPAGRTLPSVSVRRLTLLMFAFSGGVAYKLSAIKDMFYIPMQEFMGLSHTQIGGALSVYGMMQAIGLLFGIYFCDNFFKKYFIAISLVGIGFCGLYIASFPPYWGLLIAFALMSIFGEVIYWPIVLKTTRLTWADEEQGRIFGLLEMGRGIFDVVVASMAVWLFSYLGKNAMALRGSLLFLAGVTMLAGVLCYFFVPRDDALDLPQDGQGKHAAAKAGMWEALRSPAVWAVACNGFMVYIIYCGLTYFIPFLKDIYGLPVVLVSVYGIMNQYGLKILGGPIGGLMSDKVMHSAARYFRWAFSVASIGMAVFVFLPHESMGTNGNYLVGMLCTLAFGSIIFSMRAVLFAPMAEVSVRPQITGAAMSLACLITYLPGSFAYLVYGSILDLYPGMQGYRIVFSMMGAFAVGGVITSGVLARCIKSHKSV